MPASPTIQPVSLPQQRRSRRTLDKLLDAGESLLNDRTFEQLTVGDVVKRARSSVGSFYARFPDKGALLGAIYERHQRQVIETVSAEFAVERWSGMGLSAIVSAIVQRLVRLHRSHRGLLRALVLYGHTHPDWRYAVEPERQRLAVASIGRLLASRHDEITHPDPGAACSLGVLSVLATLREKILFAESTSSALRMSDKRLGVELTRQLCAYLGVAPTTQTPVGGSKRKRRPPRS